MKLEEIKRLSETRLTNHKIENYTTIDGIIKNSGPALPVFLLFCIYFLYIIIRGLSRFCNNKYRKWFSF